MISISNEELQMKKEWIDELIKGERFRYKYINDRKTLNLEQLLDELAKIYMNRKHDQKGYIIDYINSIEEENIPAVKYRPLTIEFKLKKEEVQEFVDDIKITYPSNMTDEDEKKNYRLERVIQDVKDATKKVLAEYFEYKDNMIDDIWFSIINNILDDYNNNIYNIEYYKSYKNLTTGIVQTRDIKNYKNERKYYAFRVIYPFVIIDNQYTDKLIRKVISKLKENEMYKEVKFERWSSEVKSAKNTSEEETDTKIVKIPEIYSPKENNIKYPVRSETEGSYTRYKNRSDSITSTKYNLPKFIEKCEGNISEGGGDMEYLNKSEGYLPEWNNTKALNMKEYMQEMNNPKVLNRTKEYTQETINQKVMNKSEDTAYNTTKAQIMKGEVKSRHHHRDMKKKSIINVVKWNELVVMNDYVEAYGDGYYINLNTSYVNPYFCNTIWDKNGFYRDTMKNNLLVCSEQWDRYKVYKGYTFEPNDKFMNERRKKKKTEYTIEDIVNMIDNTEDEYFINQTSKEWDEYTYSACYYTITLKDKDNKIYDKLIEKYKLHEKNEKYIKDIKYEIYEIYRLNDLYTINLLYKPGDYLIEVYDNNKKEEEEDKNEIEIKDIRLINIEIPHEEFNRIKFRKMIKEGNIKEAREYLMRYYIKIRDTNKIYKVIVDRNNKIRITKKEKIDVLEEEIVIKGKINKIKDIIEENKMITYEEDKNEEGYIIYKEERINIKGEIQKVEYYIDIDRIKELEKKIF